MIIVFFFFRGTDCVRDSVRVVSTLSVPCERLYVDTKRNAVVDAGYGAALSLCCGYLSAGGCVADGGSAGEQHQQQE